MKGRRPASRLRLPAARGLTGSAARAIGRSFPLKSTAPSATAAHPPIIFRSRLFCGDRRQPIRVLLCIFVVCCAGTEAAEKRPNILWIVAENVKLDFGCYGAHGVRTPNVDGLAASGVRYTRVFATAPACAPSRSAFMTGMYQTSTDTHHMRSHRTDDFRLPPGVRPMTHWLKDAGYSTANVTTIDGRVVGTGKLDLNFVNEGPIYDGADWSALKSHQPFFAQVNMPEVEYDIYDRKSATKPRVEWVGEREHPR